MNNTNITEQAKCDLRKAVNNKSVSLVYHAEIENTASYMAWLSTPMPIGSRRLYRVKVDPAPREKLWIDEIVIDQFPSADTAIEFLEGLSGKALFEACKNLTILSILPEKPTTFRVVRYLSKISQLFSSVKDLEKPTEHWSARNARVWPDNEQMRVARSMPLDQPLLVYNLNKYRAVADYQDGLGPARSRSGASAYSKYAKIAGKQLLRRGAFPVFGGDPVGILFQDAPNMLTDDWSHFVLVQYPERRSLLSVIEGEEFQLGQHHRDAGLERATVFMTCAVTGQA